MKKINQQVLQNPNLTEAQYACEEVSIKEMYKAILSNGFQISINPVELKKYFTNPQIAELEEMTRVMFQNYNLEQQLHLLTQYKTGLQEAISLDSIQGTNIQDQKFNFKALELTPHQEQIIDVSTVETPTTENSVEEITNQTDND